MNHVGRGGAALALLDLIKEIKLNHQDVEPIVVTGSNNELNLALTKIGVENYTAPFTNFLTTHRSPAFIWKFILKVRYFLFRNVAIRKIERVINFNDIDVIHTNLNRIDIGSYFAEKYNIKHLWHIREDGFQGLRLMPIFSNYNPLLKDTKSNIVVISEYVKQAWCSRNYFLRNVNLIYDGIRHEAFAKCEEEKFEKLSFIFVGGFHINKGQELFIRALGQLPTNLKEQINVHFYGDASLRYKQKISNLITTLRLSNTCRVFDYDPDIYEKMGKYHIGVNCSKAEGFGRITVEYMMAGLCPLISHGGANDEIINDNVDGILFDRNDPQEICDKILYLYDNIDIIKALSLNAREKAISRFSMQIHANQVCDLYKETFE